MVLQMHVYNLEKSKIVLVGYVDSNYAGDFDKRRSLTGYVFTIGGCVVRWKASLQATVLYLQLKQSIWLFLRHAKKLFD